MDSDGLKSLLETAFPEAEVAVSGGAGRFELSVVDAAFTGLNRVKRQQLVYKALGDVITSGAVHAVTIVARTPEELSA